MVSWNSSLPGMALAMLNCPPISPAWSYIVTLCPLSAAVVAKASPAGPAPTTATSISEPGAHGSMRSSSSWQATGLTRHEAVMPLKVWSRQAWLQPMQVLISSVLPSSAFLTRFASARKGLAMDTMSASPLSSTCSATCGMLILFVAHRGMFTSFMSFLVTQLKAARGTDVTMVGTRASCQPMPVLIMVAPADSMAEARATISGQEEPSETRSSMLSL
mmetsp:Transcript_5375/g.10237  ORF Transcript_5375/g.10237 Transcript_5375/m.10237 type:complete len:218 (-) Transcript_5375:738-1391(-)